MNRRSTTTEVYSRRDFMRALSEERPTEELLWMIETSPELVRDRGDYGSCLPIHAACERRASLEVIQKLVEVFPEGLSMGYDEDDTDIPIFLALRESPPCTEIITYLIDAYPDCLRGTPDRVPLFHYACRTGNDPEWYQLLLEISNRYPEAWYERDYLGFYPIHHLAQGTSVQMLNVFCKMDPTKILDSQGNHLLHYAVDDSLYTGHGHGLVAYLIQTYPEAVVTPNQKGDLPIHVALWPRDRELLWKHDPFTLIYPGSDGRTVLGMIEKLVNEIHVETRQMMGDDLVSEDEFHQHVAIECQDYWAELDLLRNILSQRVIPPIKRATTNLLQKHNLPMDVLDQMMEYMIPEYEDATRSGVGRHRKILAPPLEAASLPPKIVETILAFAIPGYAQAPPYAYA